MLTAYRHRNWQDDSDIELPVGKAFCVGRNYSEHIAELGNNPLQQPLLFSKHQNAFCDMSEAVVVPSRFGSCHHEVELALLIGSPMSFGTKHPLNSIWGYGLALDLTLRDLQSALKDAGHPWEKAKAFDGSCPLSPFVPAACFAEGEPFRFSLTKNGQQVQIANSEKMLFSMERLLTSVLEYFSLQPGDMVLTGTPAGVGELVDGDELELELQGEWNLATRVERP